MLRSRIENRFFSHRDDVLRVDNSGMAANTRKEIMTGLTIWNFVLILSVLETSVNTHTFMQGHSHGKCLKEDRSFKCLCY